MAPGLCENCHQRPKFGTHRFCGKTCAAQAVTKPMRSNQPQPQAKAGPRNTSRQQARPPPKQPQLCTYCGQKPKYNNFDYCGKSCAALAQTKPSTTPGASATKQKQKHTQNAPPNTVTTPAAVPQKAHKVGTRPIPVVPQGDSTEEDEESEEREDGGVSTDLDAYPSDSGSESEDEPSVPVSQPGGKSAHKGGKFGSGASSIVSGACAIPKCGQPSHVDKNGVKTKYCSTKHREEAVKLGLEPACIMCQQYPQSSSDYFCSSACRNQSMTKT